MREINLFLFKQYELLPFMYLLDNFTRVFNGCFTREKANATHLYQLHEV
jgi:hypothetical protein